MIIDKDISVVVQGAIVHENDVTSNVCRSIRKFMPSAEIIVSTWVGSDVLGIEYDVLIVNEDPGYINSYYDGYDSIPYVNNINRQIVSTLNGIKASKRKYVMKLRSDSVLIKDNFLMLYNKYSNDGQKIACFEPRNPWGNFKNQLALCDFWFLGEKNKLLELWEIKSYENVKINERNILGEEYLMGRFVEKKYDIPLEEFIIGSQNYRDTVYKHTLCEDFVIFPTRKTGIVCRKYPKLNDFFTVCIKHYVVSFSDWAWMEKNRFWGCNRFYFAHLLQSICGGIILIIKRKNIWTR